MDINTLAQVDVCLFMQGDQGSQGPPGEQGAKGVPGVRGERGPQGPSGNPVSSCAVHTTTMLP